jgi:hypothetical protein
MLSTAAVLMLCIATASAESRSDKPAPGRHHIIISYDISGSMIAGMTRDQQERVNDYLLAILYDRLPTTAGPGDSINRVLLEKGGLEVDKGLYQKGDLLTVMTFGQEVKDIVARKRDYEPRYLLKMQLPDKFPAQLTRITYATLKAYEKYRPDDGETFWIVVSDEKEDARPKDKEFKDQISLYQVDYALRPRYALTVGGKVHIRIYSFHEIAPSKDSKPAPVPQPFYVVGARDTAKQVGALVFDDIQDPAAARLHPGYRIVLNPTLKQVWSVSKLFAVVSHTSTNDIEWTKEIPLSQISAPPIDLPQFEIPIDYLTEDYRISLKIVYHYKNIMRVAYNYRTHELRPVRNVTDPFTVTDRMGDPIVGPKVLQSEDGRFSSSPIWLSVKPGVPPGSVRIDEAKWTDALQRLEIPLKTEAEPAGRVKLIPDLDAQSVPFSLYNQPLDGALRILSQPAGAKDFTSMLRLPLSVKFTPGDLGAYLFSITSDSDKTKKHVELRWNLADSSLRGEDVQLSWSRRIPQMEIRLSEARLKAEGESLWSGTLDTKALGTDVPIELTTDQSKKLWEVGPSEALLSVDYRAPDADESQTAEFTVPLVMKDPPVPEPFEIAGTTVTPGPKPVVRMAWEGDRLQISGVRTEAKKSIPDVFQPKVVGLSLSIADRKSTIDIEGETEPEIAVTVPGADLMGKSRAPGLLEVAYKWKPSSQELSQQIPLTLAVPPTTPIEPFRLVSASNPDTPLQKKPGFRSDLSNGSYTIDTFMVGLKPDTQTGMLTEIEDVSAKFGEVEIDAGIKPGKPSCPIGVNLTIPGSDAGKLTRQHLESGKILITYRQAGNDKALIQTLPLRIEPRHGGTDRVFTLLMGLLVIAGIGVLAWMIIRQRSESTAAFRLVWTDSAFGAPTVEAFTMKKGERLALSKSEGAEHYSEITECPGTSIICKGRGKLVLIRPHTSEETEMKEGTEYEVETGSGARTNINIYWDETERERDEKQPEDRGSEGVAPGGGSESAASGDSQTAQSGNDEGWL